MICTNCFEADYQTVKTDLCLMVNDQERILRDLDCETCPACGAVTFSEAQNLEIDKKRIMLEFCSRPLLTPVELKSLRCVLGMNLNEICDLLHLRYTYGRWERGEAEIPLSINLLVHNLIEKIPDAPVNVFEKQRVAAIDKANAYLLKNELSFGEYLQKVIALTHLMPEIVSEAVGIPPAELSKIKNNLVPPERIPPEVTARIARYFSLPVDTLLLQLKELQRVTYLKHSGTAAQERPSRYDGRFPNSRVPRLSLVYYKPAQEKNAPQDCPKLGEEYLARVKAAVAGLQWAPGQES
jgi:hypothetical protein